jgi:hypothetical protein
VQGKAEEGYLSVMQVMERYAEGHKRACCVAVAATMDLSCLLLAGRVCRYHKLQGWRTVHKFDTGVIFRASHVCCELTVLLCILDYDILAGDRVLDNALSKEEVLSARTEYIQPSNVNAPLVLNLVGFLTCSLSFLHKLLLLFRARFRTILSRNLIHISFYIVYIMVNGLFAFARI